MDKIAQIAIKGSRKVNSISVSYIQDAPKKSCCISLCLFTLSIVALFSNWPLLQDLMKYVEADIYISVETMIYWNNWCPELWGSSHHITSTSLHQFDIRLILFFNLNVKTFECLEVGMSGLAIYQDVLILIFQELIIFIPGVE